MSVRDRTARTRGVTLFEIIAVGPAGEKLLVSYTNHKSRSNLIRIIRFHGEHAVKVFGSEAFDIIKGGGITIGAWTVRFSGRTELDAKTSGELPFWRAT